MNWGLLNKSRQPLLDGNIIELKGRSRHVSSAELHIGPSAHIVFARFLRMRTTGLRLPCRIQASRASLGVWFFAVRPRACSDVGLRIASCFSSPTRNPAPSASSVLYGTHATTICAIADNEASLARPHLHLMRILKLVHSTASRCPAVSLTATVITISTCKDNGLCYVFLLVTLLLAVFKFVFGTAHRR